jgi:cell division protein FtsW
MNAAAMRPRSTRAGLLKACGRGKGAARRLPPAVRDQAGGSGAPGRIAGFDQTLVWWSGAARAGVVMVYSASVALPDNPKFARYSRPPSSCSAMLLSLAIGLRGALVVVQVPIKPSGSGPRAWSSSALVLLVLVLMPFIGKVVNGSRRWIPLGFMNFQPSELAKLAIAMYAASYMVRKMDVKENFFRPCGRWRWRWRSSACCCCAEPDMGAFIVIAAIAMGILFLGGVNGRMFFLIARCCWARPSR